MIVCGLWVLLFTAPLFLTMRDRPIAEAPQGLGILGSYKALFGHIASIWRTNRHLAYFLLASALFRDGLAAVFAFGAVVAAQAFGFEFTEIILFAIAASLIAALVTMLLGLLDDKIGPKKVILLCLGIIVSGAVILFFLHQPAYAVPPQIFDPTLEAYIPNPAYDPALAAQGKTLFWIFGLLLSSLVGPVQAAARSLLARVVPEGHSAEIFGLYTTTGRAVSFLSPAAFGLFIILGEKITGTQATQHWGLLAIAFILLLGLIALIPVKVLPRQR